MNPEREDSSGFERFEGIENKVLEAAKSTRLAEIIEYDTERGKNRVSEKFQESSFFDKCLEELRNAVFWEELMIRLAERDLVRQLGEKDFLALGDDDRRKKPAPLEKRYWEKFQKDGMNPLFWIDPNEDA